MELPEISDLEGPRHNQLDPLQLYERSREREVRRGDEIRRNVINFLCSELGNVGLKVEPEYKRSVYKVGDNVRFLLKASAEADPYKDHERCFFGVMPEIYFEKLFFAGEDNRPEYRFALFACGYRDGMPRRLYAIPADFLVTDSTKISADGKGEFKLNIEIDAGNQWFSQDVEKRNIGKYSFTLEQLRNAICGVYF